MSKKLQNNSTTNHDHLSINLYNLNSKSNTGSKNKMSNSIKRPLISSNPPFQVVYTNPSSSIVNTPNSLKNPKDQHPYKSKSKAKSYQNSRQKITNKKSDLLSHRFPSKHLAENKNVVSSLHDSNPISNNKSAILRKTTTNKFKESTTVQYQGLATENTKIKHRNSKTFRNNANNHQGFFQQQRDKSQKRKSSAFSTERRHVTHTNTSSFNGKNLSQHPYELGITGNSNHRKMSINNNTSANNLSGKSISRKKQLEWTSNHAPYNWKTVVQLYSHYLTKFEMNEIKQYKKIYYIGHKAKKTEQEQSRTIQQGFSVQVVSQPQFDNQQKQYQYQINDHIAYRYEIISPLGKGSYGQVIKAYDHKKHQQVAIKIIRNKQKFNQQAFIEIKLLTHIKENDQLENTSNIIRIKDFIIFRQHVCIIFELLSENLYELIIRNGYNGLNPELIRRFAIQILSSLHFMKKHKIIHCDLKPENILLRQYSKSGIKIIDLGSSCFENETKYTYIQSRYYRAPEITLGLKYSFQIDMWSLGCILFELYTGVPLFPGQNQNQQMIYMVSTLGNPPKSVLDKGERSNIFFEVVQSQEQNQFSETYSSNNNGIRLNKNIQMKTKIIDHFSKPIKERIPNDEKFCQFLQGFFTWNPKQRINPIQAMNHQWILEGLPSELRHILPVIGIDDKNDNKFIQKKDHQQKKFSDNQYLRSKQSMKSKSKQRQTSKMKSGLKNNYIFTNDKNIKSISYKKINSKQLKQFKSLSQQKAASKPNSLQKNHKSSNQQTINLKQEVQRGNKNSKYHNKLSQNTNLYELGNNGSKK